MGDTNALPRILLLMTGGTITMIKNEQDLLVPAKGIDEIVKTFPRMGGIAQIHSELICDIDSSNMTPEIWKQLAETIYTKYSDYEAFVITHGTDTLAYTSSALSLALQNLHKPVILTGAQTPITELGSDSQFNLFNSFKVASQGNVQEVAIVFDTRILRGNRTSKKSSQKMDAFWSPQFQMLGEIGVAIRYFTHKNPFPAKKKLSLKADFESDIVSLNLFPGFMPKILEKIVEENLYKGIVLRGFGTGNISTNTPLLSILQKARDKGIPVVLIAPCPSGGTHLHLYETGQKALEAGAISAKDMTLETATVKLSWALAQTKDLSQIKEIMHSNIAGEISQDLKD